MCFRYEAAGAAALTDGLLLGAAVVLSYALAPLSIRLGARWGLMDAPSGDLKRHTTPTPRSGGIGIVIAVLVVTAVAAFTARAHVGAAELIPAVLLFALGLWDDRRPRSPIVRLLIQIAIYLIAFALGIRLLTAWPPWLGFAAGLIWFVVVVNAMNFYDGLDGLLTLTAVLALGVWGALSAGAAPGGFVALVGVAALLGFLPRNWPPARIFLGDGGSFLVGYLFFLASCQATVGGFGVTAGLWVAAVPVCDAGAATLDRLFRGRSIWSGDRDHIYDILDRRGWSCAQIATVLGLMAGVSAAVPVFLRDTSRDARWIAIVVLYVLMTGIVWSMRVRFRAVESA